MWNWSLRRRTNRELGKKGFFEKIVADNFPNLMTGTYLQIQNAEQTAKRINKDCHTEANC